MATIETDGNGVLSLDGQRVEPLAVVEVELVDGEFLKIVVTGMDATCGGLVRICVPLKNGHVFDGIVRTSGNFRWPYDLRSKG